MRQDHCPTVIWMGRAPIVKTPSRFRLVYRGPARPERPDDVPFAVEQNLGLSMMKRLNWGKPNSQDGKQQAIWALSHVLGSVLMIDPSQLAGGHPIHCEMNMAIIEGREPRGCDCDGPDEPDEKLE